MSSQKVLVLGGTGAMGRYLVPELVAMGYTVDVVSLDDVVSDTPGLRYIRGDAKADGFLETVLKNGYDGVVDFMVWYTEDFRRVYPLFLENTDHYVFLSSCRVYADAPPISESSPRLLDVSTDADFLATEDYALYKAREENLLRSSGRDNWTIVRPATTFSTGRFQLVTLEASELVYRMQAGKTVVLPEEAMTREATLSWGGDVGKMIARLLFLPEARGQDFIVATAEHHSWAEIASIYQEICPFRFVTVSTEDYLSIVGPGQAGARYQLIYARLFQRITDNSKVLKATGLRQSDLRPLRDGLRFEYERSKSMDWARFAGSEKNVRMDAYLEKHAHI